MRIYVRSKKDLKAVSHAIETFYKLNSDIELFRLGGKEKEKLEEKIQEIPSNDFSLVILGHEDKKYVKNLRDLETPTRKVVFARTSRVRNLRLSEIFNLIEASKFRFLLDVAYDSTLGTYRLGFPGKLLPKNSHGDIYFNLWQEFLAALDIKVPLSALILHIQSQERVYWEEREILRIFRDLGEVVKLEELQESEKEQKEALKKLLEANREYIKEKLRVTLTKLKRVTEQVDYDNLVIPWSGGKDSTAVILLAKKLNLDFVAVHVDTGCEFPQTSEYVKALAEKLNLELHVAEAPVCKHYRLFGEQYLQERKCTIDKISSLYGYIERNFGNALILVGDRIAESRIRSLRPELAKDKFWVYYPIKYWSYADIQLLTMLESLELNKLYSYGFYRIGCKVCPFLDAIEKKIMEWMKEHALL